MPVEVSCACGKLMAVKDEFAGRKVRCPQCGAAVAVPEAGLPVVDPIEEPDEVAAPPARADRCWRLDGYETVFAVSEEALFIATFGDAEADKAVRAMGRGVPARRAMKQASKVVSFADLKKVESNLHHAFIDFTWRARGESEDSDSNVLFASKDQRDEVMDELERRLGWGRERIEYSRLRAALAPLLPMVFIAFLGFCFYMVATGQDTSSGGGTKVVRTNLIGAIIIAIYNFFGPWPLVIIALLLLALCAVWLAMRVVTPPVMDTLAPGKPARKRRRGA